MAGECRRFDPAWLNPLVFGKIRSAHVPESHPKPSVRIVQFGPSRCRNTTVQSTDGIALRSRCTYLDIGHMQIAHVDTEQGRGECKSGSTGFIWNADSTGYLRSRGLEIRPPLQRDARDCAVSISPWASHYNRAVTPLPGVRYTVLVFLPVPSLT
jgi:hypothetical protein